MTTRSKNTEREVKIFKDVGLLERNRTKDLCVLITKSINSKNKKVRKVANKLPKDPNIITESANIKIPFLLILSLENFANALNLSI